MPDTLPTDKQLRKNAPMARGLLDYFPLALAYVAEVSRVGNEQHNPGEPIHWARDKSTDHADCLLRHLVDRGKIDIDQLRHSGKIAWRALALLQEELEAALRRTGPAPGVTRAYDHDARTIKDVYPDGSQEVLPYTLDTLGHP